MPVAFVTLTTGSEGHDPVPTRTEVTSFRGHARVLPNTRTRALDPLSAAKAAGMVVSGARMGNGAVLDCDSSALLAAPACASVLCREDERRDGRERGMKRIQGTTTTTTTTTRRPTPSRSAGQHREGGCEAVGVVVEAVTLGRADGAVVERRPCDGVVMLQETGPGTQEDTNVILIAIVPHSSRLARMPNHSDRAHPA